MKKSLRQRILNYLKANPGVWISGDELEKKSQSAGYKASTGSRRSRELHEDNLSYEPQLKTVDKVKIENGRAVVYREEVLVWKPAKESTAITQ